MMTRRNGEGGTALPVKSAGCARPNHRSASWSSVSTRHGRRDSLVLASLQAKLGISEFL